MSGPVHIGVLGQGLSGANAGLVQFDTGTVLVTFTVAVFIMLLTS
jgi:hypothetical protein